MASATRELPTTAIESGVVQAPAAVGSWAKTEDPAASENSRETAKRFIVEIYTDEVGRVLYLGLEN